MHTLLCWFDSRVETAMDLSFVVFMIFAASIHVSISKPYDIAVVDISAESAAVSWKTTETPIKIERFKVHCNGTRRYVSTDDQKLLDTYDKIQYAPAGKDNLLLGDLQANVNYSCIIWEHVSDETQVLHGQVSEPFHFATDYGVPEEAMAPNVLQNAKNHSIIIWLFSTSTRFGPISGYHVQFHLVESKINENLPLIDDEEFEPFSPLSSLVSKNIAQKSTKAKSFWIDFKTGMLPTNIVIDENLLNGTLKSGLEYTVVTVPYTFNTKFNKTAIFFTPSQMSSVFRTYSQKSASLNISEQADLVICITLGVILPVVVLFYLFCFGAIVYCVLKRRKKKKEKKRSRRDLVEASTRARADDQGDELPWYYQQTNEDTLEDRTMTNSASSQTRRSSSSGAQTKMIHGQHGNGTTEEQHELQEFTREPNQSAYNEWGSRTLEQNVQTSPRVAESTMYEDQNQTITSMSAESFLTPNSSLSHSLTSKHASLLQTSEVEDNEHILMAEYSLARNEMSNTQLDTTQQSSDGCDLCSVPVSCSLSSDVIDMTIEEAILVPNDITSDFVETFGPDETLREESPSERSIAQREGNNMAKDLSDDSELSDEMFSTDNDHLPDGTLELIDSNVELREEISAAKVLVIDHEECQAEKIVESANSNILHEDIDTDDKELSDGVPEHENNGYDTREEATIMDSFLSNQMIENNDNRIGLTKESSLVEGCVTERVLESVYSSCSGVRQDVTDIEELHLEGTLECVDISVSENEELQSEQSVNSIIDLTETNDELLTEIQLKFVESNNDFREDISVTNILPQVKEKLEHGDHPIEEVSEEHFRDLDRDLKSVSDNTEKAHVYLTEQSHEGVNNYQLCVSEEVSLNKDAGKLELVNSRTDLGKNVLIEEQTLGYIDSSIDLRENISTLQEHPFEKIVNTDHDFQEEYPVMVKSLSGAKLTHVDGSIDLREDVFDHVGPQMSGMIKRITNNIDLSGDLSVIEVEKDDVNFITFAGGEEEAQNEYISINMLPTSDSDSVYAQVLEPSDLCITQNDDTSKYDTGDSDCDEHRPALQIVQSSSSVVQSTSDHVCINIEQGDHEESHFQSTSKVAVSNNSLAPKQFSEVQSPSQKFASSNHLRSHSQLKFPYSSSSLPDISQINQPESHSCSLQPSKSFGTELISRSPLQPPTSNTRNKICDAQSIQLSRISNQSKSTSSGNYSLTSQIFKHSIDASESELSGHYRPPSAKSGSSKIVSNPSKSSISHSLTSHEYKYSDYSGSSDVIFTKTMESQCLANTSFEDKQINSVYCSTTENSDAFKEMTETALKVLPVPCSDSDAIEVLTVSVANNFQIIPPGTKTSGQFSSSKKLGQFSEESVCLHHSKPTINLAHEYSIKDSPPKGCVLQSSNTLAIQLEEPAKTIEQSRESESDVAIGTDHSSGHWHAQTLMVSSESSSDSVKSGIKKSQAHIAVAAESTSDVFLDAIDTKRSTLSNTNTTGSSSRMSTCSTEYYTALESIDLSSESSVGMWHSTDTRQSAFLSSGSGSEHRDSNQIAVEPTIVGKGNALLKMSSSASLFIPRGLSSGPQDNSSASIPWGRGSTCTLSSILAQLSESSVSEEDQQTGHSAHQSQTDQTARVYEPY